MIKLFFFSFYLATFFLPQIAGATDRCDHALKKHRLGAQFLNGRNAKLHNTDFVNKISRLRAYPELSPSSAPVDKLSLWLEHMEKTHFPKKNREEVNPRSENEAVTRATDDGPNNRAAASGQISKIKKYYLRRHVIQPQGVPESYFDFQKRIARERGDNDFEISDWERQERIKQIIAGQKRSLEIWLDYLLSEDTAMYPMWSKYWVFTGLVKLGLFEKEKGRFTKRTPSTVAPFPELNREALAYVIDGVIKTVHKESLESIQDPIFLKLLEKKSDFGSLYIQALRRTMGEIHSLATVSGQWITYKQ